MNIFSNLIHWIKSSQQFSFYNISIADNLIKVLIVRKIKIKIKRKIASFLQVELARVLESYFLPSNVHVIGTSKEITLGKGIYIDASAIVKSVFGGKIKIGANTSIAHGVCIMTYGGDIEIGENCDINPYTIIYGHGTTKIGNNVLIAGQCMIIPNNHNIADTSKPISLQGNTSKGIIIEDDVWIGHGCTILDGVTIGSGSVIAAGAVVNRSIPNFSIAGGVPCKIIKQR